MVFFPDDILNLTNRKRHPSASRCADFAHIFFVSSPCVPPRFSLLSLVPVPDFFPLHPLQTPGGFFQKFLLVFAVLVSFRFFVIHTPLCAALLDCLLVHLIPFSFPVLSRGHLESPPCPCLEFLSRFSTWTFSLFLTNVFPL